MSEIHNENNVEAESDIVEELLKKNDEIKKTEDVKKPFEGKDFQITEILEENNQLNKTLNNLKQDLQTRTEERENYKNKTDNLESEINELKKKKNILSPAQQDEVKQMKKKSDELLTRAKGIIFEKTKVCKNQELQIEALNEQVSSLKEVLSITKSLLEIRNIEVKHLQEKMENMDAKINAEKQRQDLMNKKMDALVTMNESLKIEYEKQLLLLKEMHNKQENDNN